jgi:hypothetical protein
LPGAQAAAERFGVGQQTRMVDALMFASYSRGLRRHRRGSRDGSERSVAVAISLTPNHKLVFNKFDIRQTLTRQPLFAAFVGKPTPEPPLREGP